MTAGNDDASGHRLYDWWSRHPRLLQALYGAVFLGRESTFRRRTVRTLDLSPGERVLEVGCGTGNSFAALRAGVGSTGSVVGLDVSRGMVRSARVRIREAGWQNVHVVRGDARQPPVADEGFDAAYAAMSISAVPDPEQAIEATATTLRPGGRLVVLDARPLQQWPLRFANPIVVPLAERATNWVPRVDLVGCLRRQFETVDVTTFTAGAIVIARARTS